MSNKTYTVAGISTLNGVVKPRFATDMDKRMFMLGYTGHTDVTLLNLPTEMSKLEAVQFLQTNEHMQGEAAQAALAAYVQKNTPKAPGLRGRPLKLPTLDDVPMRGDKGVFLKREVREQMLADMIADRISQHEAKKARAADRAAERAALPALEQEEKIAAAEDDINEADEAEADVNDVADTVEA